jgi:hypothetical protein
LSRPLALLLAITLTVAACSMGSAPSPSPAAEPAAGEAFAILTAKAKPQACMDALITGKLTRNGGSGLGLTTMAAPPVAVEWPFRYSAREEGGRVALLDETGTVVALEGETVQMGGGLGQLNIWFTCGPVARVEAIR